MEASEAGFTCAICLDDLPPPPARLPCCGTRSTIQYCADCVAAVCRNGVGGVGRCPTCRAYFTVDSAGTITQCERQDVCACAARAASSSPSTAVTRCATRATLAGRCRCATSAQTAPPCSTFRTQCTGTSARRTSSAQRRGRATAAATSRCGAWRKRTRRACLPPTLQSRGAAGMSGSRRFARSGPHAYGADCPHSPRGSLAAFFPPVHVLLLLALVVDSIRLELRSWLSRAFATVSRLLGLLGR